MVPLSVFKLGIRLYIVANTNFMKLFHFTR